MVNCVMEENKILFYGYDPVAIQQYKKHRGRYNPAQKSWSIPDEELPLLIQSLYAESVSMQIMADVKTYLDKTIQKNENTITDTLEKIKEIEKEYSITLYQHQRDSIVSLLSHPRFGLFDEMGTGKTLSMLVAVKILGFSVLIVCPKSVIQVWRLEGKRLGMDFQKYNGHNGQHKYLIVNYDRLATKNVELVAGMESDRILVADESHKIKNRQAQRSKSFVELAKKAKYIYLLSGTPGANKPDDIWRQVSLLNPALFGTYWDFVKRFCNLGNRFSEWAITGYKNLEGMSRMVATVSIRHTKKDCLDLPEKIYLPQYLSPSSDQDRMLRELQEDKSFDVENETISVSNILALIMRSVQIASNPRSLDPTYSGENPKIEWLKEFIEDDFENSHLVIFSNFHDSIDLISENLTQYDCRKFDGRTQQTEREAILQWFQQPTTNGKKKILIGNPATMGEGLNLQIASTVIFFDRNYNLTHYSQAQDRVHRIGQHSPVNIINLLLEDTIDERILQVLTAKKEMQRLTLQELKSILIG